jgi:hypothetical protein
MTHQPDWLLHWYENGDSKNNVSDLIYNILKEMCKLRIAGDIHHYMRHSIAKSDVLVSSQIDKEPAIVNGSFVILMNLMEFPMSAKPNILLLKLQAG